eukprot:4847-Prorocentrum_minimum.AAC.1
MKPSCTTAEGTAVRTRRLRPSAYSVLDAATMKGVRLNLSKVPRAANASTSAANRSGSFSGDRRTQQ